MAKKPLEITCSNQFVPWLTSSGISLAFTTYQTNRLFLIGVGAEGRLSGFERFFDRPMGLHAAGDRLYMSTRYQLWELDNSLPQGETYNGYDRLYVPRRSYVTGEIDMHDIALDGHGRALFVNTAFSCLATASDRYSFRSVWKPPFISRLAPEDRCHLNGLAMADGMPAYVTAVSRSDVVSGWRERRHEGGCVIDVEDNEIVLDSLSMPHSPRIYRERLWLLNSGTGELGWVDRSKGVFEPIAFCPGFGRGLVFDGDYAIVGLSKPRRSGAFSGLKLDDALKAKDAEARCGLWVIDTRTGNVAHWMELSGVVAELYDVVVLPGVRRPMALGFKNDEIRRLITIEDDERVLFAALPAASKSNTPQEKPLSKAASQAYRQGNRLAAQERFAEAIPFYEAVLREAPRHQNALLNLGTAKYRTGAVGAALELYRAALVADPGSTLANFNIGRVELERGNLEEAAARFRQAVGSDHADSAAMQELALTLAACGRLSESRHYLEQSLAQEPDSAEAHNNLGSVLRLERREQDAIGHFRRAAELRPDFFEAHENLGMVLEDQGYTEEAVRSYRDALSSRNDPVTELHCDLLCPPVFDSQEMLDAYRSRIEGVLRGFPSRPIAMDMARVQSSRGGSAAFEWTYQHSNNLQLKQSYAALFSNVFESLGDQPRVSRSDPPWRVGFVVTASHEGVFARCMGGLIARLDRSRFEPLVACSPLGRSVVESAIPGVPVLELPLRFDHAVQALRSAELDAIYFWEVGTDQTNYFLPFVRLAPLQCSGWGWPETSAAPELDCHLTTDSLAPVGVDGHFSEELVRMPHLPAFCKMPPYRGVRKELEDFGVSRNQRLYLCTQTLRKVQPAVDDLFRGILEADSGAVIACIHDRFPYFGERLQRRWDRSLAAYGDRLLLLDRLAPRSYMDLLASADVILDTPQFGGCNTVYDAVAAGTPVVTLPGGQPRSRYAAAVLMEAGADECVAATASEYVAKALETANDAGLRSRLSDRLIQEGAALFSDDRAVRQLEDFFESRLGAG